MVSFNQKDKYSKSIALEKGKLRVIGGRKAVLPSVILMERQATEASGL